MQDRNISDAYKSDDGGNEEKRKDSGYHHFLPFAALQWPKNHRITQQIVDQQIIGLATNFHCEEVAISKEWQSMLTEKSRKRPIVGSPSGLSVAVLNGYDTVLKLSLFVQFQI